MSGNGCISREVTIAGFALSVKLLFDTLLFTA